MIRLRNDRLSVGVDPCRGGVIRSIRSTRTNEELLYQAPWPAAPLSEADRDETAWTCAWRGGWNVLFPNAGAACVVGGRTHPFHGSASAGPWSVIAPEPAVTLRFGDADGLWIERSIDLEGTRVTVRNAVGNAGAGPVAYVLVEHLIFGGTLVDDDSVVLLNGGEIVPLADDGPPLGPPAATGTWPTVRRELEVEDWSRRPERPTSRFGAVSGAPTRSADIGGSGAGLTVRVTWSEAFPYLWFWEEQTLAAGTPWEGRVRCLGLEPASISTGLGLAAAVESGEASWLDPGDRADSWVGLELLD